MNKFIVLSALLAVAAAAPEADPLLVYGLVSPHAKTAGLVTHANGAVVPTDTVSVQAARAGHLAYKGLYGYYGYPYAHHYLGKREAESKADADPYLLYGAYHHYPHITSVGAFTTYSNGAVTPTNTPAVQLLQPTTLLLRLPIMLPMDIHFTTTILESVTPRPMLIPFISMGTTPL